MFDFTFYNPVRIHFGHKQMTKLSTEIPKNARILLTYGGGSIKKNGVYAEVMQNLAGYEVIEFGGIEPNPQYDTLMQAVQIIREKNIAYIVAVGGGSVIDGTKFIAAATHFVGEPWDILAKQAPITKAVPFGCVLTLPAAGSEMNCGAVISRRSSGDKLVFGNPLVFPQFSILDPETTFSLPPNQTSNGIIDAFVHVIEQYLTYPVNSPIQDRFAEGILTTLIEEAPKVLKNPKDYDARANIMWSSTMALNNLIASGVPQDWSTHLIGHELTAKFNLDHGQTLAIVLPSVLHIKREAKREKLLQYAKRIWNINAATEDAIIDVAIQKTREFFESLGVKTRLADYNITAAAIPELVNQLAKHQLTALGEHEDIDLATSELILRNCL